MNDFFDVSDISRLIEIAVAPVFLITGIGSLLNVLGSRLSRVVDRARYLSQNREDEVHRVELEVQIRRMNLAGWSIGLCVTSALLICSLVALIFLGGLLHFDPYEIIGILFVLSMICLIAGLILLLLEIRLALRFNWLRADLARSFQRRQEKG